MWMLSASSVRKWFNRRGAGSRMPGRWGVVSADSEPKAADICIINLRKKKKPTCRIAAVGWLKSSMETLLQSCLSTHTGHSRPRRQVLTTTGSRDGSETAHDDLEYLTGLDVTNPLFASQLSVNSMVDRRVWLPHRVFQTKSAVRECVTSIRFNLP